MADPADILPGKTSPAVALPDAQPVPPTDMMAGASHNSGLAREWQPNLDVAAGQAESAAGQISPLVKGYQAQAARFLAEHGAAVVGGHAPVGLSAANPAGEADMGGPGNPGQTDG